MYIPVDTPYVLVYFKSSFPAYTVKRIQERVLFYIPGTRRRGLSIGLSSTVTRRAHFSEKATRTTLHYLRHFRTQTHGHV